MKEKRYYYNGEIKLNSIVNLYDEEFHHLANVMRTRVGEKICLFNGDGNFYFGEVKSLNKKFAEILVTSMEKSENEPKVKLTIYQALAKGDKLSLIMQKITEIGANKLSIFESEFCDVKSNTQKKERMDNITISASKQCGRATIVECDGIYKLKDVYEQIKTFDAFYVAYEAEDGKTLAKELINNKDKLNNIAIMIGAEGGFSKEEIKLLQENGAIIVSLGNRILRTETASIVTAGLAMQILETT